MLRKGMFLADRYEILEQIGTGGMSDVYKAKCHKLNRFVAIKVLKHEFSEDKTFVSKFRVEAQSAAGLTHPNIVNVYDVGDENGIYYIVMELIEGITLKKYIEKRGRLPYKEAVSIAIQVANGIEAAHSHHIIHRDIKPQNIIISKEGKVKVTDFGIAKAASSSTINSSSEMGSVHYISPEQARGGYSDERSDIYSFGITLFEMLTGTLPFDGDSTVAVAVRHIQDDIPVPSTVASDIPLSIDKIVLKCTQKKTERRYQSASELIADLKKSLVMPDEDFVKMMPMYDNGVNNNINDAAADNFKKAELQDRNPDDDLDDGLDDELDDLDDFEDEGLFGGKKKKMTDDNSNKISEDINDENNDKLEKMMKWIGIGIVAVILLVTIYFVLRFLGVGAGSSSSTTKTTTAVETTATADTSSKVTVPNVVGKTEAEAKKELNDVNLGYKVTYQSSSTVEKGKIISQDKKSGSKVDKNTTLTLTISSGEETKASKAVPNVSGMTEENAITTLKNSGFSVNASEYEYSDKVEKGNVIKQTPSGGTSAEEGSAVTIYVSRGKETKSVTVPNVVGLAEGTARQTIENNGLVCSVTYVSTASNVAYGNVVSQSYSAGTSVESGSTISIVVSTYQETTTQAATTAANQSTTAAANQSTAAANQTATTAAN